MSPLPPDQVRTWLDPVLESPKLYLVPVYTQDSGNGDNDVNVIGFAAFSFKLIDGPVPGPVDIQGTFHKMFYDAAYIAPIQGPDVHGLYDFGVRTIGLSG